LLEGAPVAELVDEVGVVGGPEDLDELDNVRVLDYIDLFEGVDFVFNKLI